MFSGPLYSLVVNRVLFRPVGTGSKAQSLQSRFFFNLIYAKLLQLSADVFNGLREEYTGVPSLRNIWKKE